MKDILIEGVDRLGKDSLIVGIQHELGFFQEVHYQKPRLLDSYVKLAVEHGTNPDQEAMAYQRYQDMSFRHMFNMLSMAGRHIMNRAHLGEAVYAHRYRRYDGNYVFELEKKFYFDFGSKFADRSLLVLLTTSDFSFIKDDGLSFDFNKKEEEQADFIKAFNKSIIKNKLLIDVSNGKGGYRPKADIVQEVLDAFKGK